MALISTTEPTFLAEVEELLNTQGEILVELRYSRMAGSRDILLFGSFAAFQERLTALSAPTLIDVYRHYSLPLRGVITEQFIQTALAELSSAAQYLIVYRPAPHPQRLFSFQDGEGAAELEENLRETLGQQAAVGASPDCSEASGDCLRAIVPDADGSISVGVY